MFKNLELYDANAVLHEIKISHACNYRRFDVPSPFQTIILTFAGKASFPQFLYLAHNFMARMGRFKSWRLTSCQLHGCSRNGDKSVGVNKWNFLSQKTEGWGFPDAWAIAVSLETLIYLICNKYFHQKSGWNHFICVQVRISCFTWLEG